MSKTIPFEKSLADLEKIVLQLEKGELTLDDCLKHYEKGIHLARQCQAALTQAEQKIETLKTRQLQEEEDQDEPF